MDFEKLITGIGLQIFALVLAMYKESRGKDKDPTSMKKLIARFLLAGVLCISIFSVDVLILENEGAEFSLLFFVAFFFFLVAGFFLFRLLYRVFWHVFVS